MTPNNIIKVLIVEDDTDLQSVYMMILQSQGYNVEVAGDGIAALNILHDFIPDIILLDYLMPRMDGKNFLENFDNSRFPDTKIVVCSNISDQSVLDSMLSLGAHEYVLKSGISPVDLVRLVERLTAHSQ